MGTWNGLYSPSIPWLVKTGDIGYLPGTWSCPDNFEWGTFGRPISPVVMNQVADGIYGYCGRPFLKWIKFSLYWRDLQYFPKRWQIFGKFPDDNRWIHHYFRMLLNRDWRGYCYLVNWLGILLPMSPIVTCIFIMMHFMQLLIFQMQEHIFAWNTSPVRDKENLFRRIENIARSFINQCCLIVMRSRLIGRQAHVCNFLL